MINNHSLFGEADHPETRLEISLQNVSHAINDLWIEGDKVLAVIDILPTPMGKIISELLDYGTNIGISSRGAGTVLRDNSVDPDDYQFVTFDFVARPSCEAARLNTILESASIEAQNTKDDEIKNLLEGYKSSLSESEDGITIGKITNHLNKLLRGKIHKVDTSDSLRPHDEAVIEFNSGNSIYHTRVKLERVGSGKINEGRAYNIAEAVTTENTNDTTNKKPNCVVFYLNGKELGGHDLKYEFEGERDSAKELYACENDVKPEDIEERLEYRENMNESDLLESIRDSYINDTVKELLK